MRKETTLDFKNICYIQTIIPIQIFYKNIQITIFLNGSFYKENKKKNAALDVKISKFLSRRQ